MARSQSFRFDGGAATFFGTGILAWLLTLFTLGLGYPWALCMFQQWKCKHTFIDGRRLRFVGGGWSLIGLWIKWFVLLLITFGIYSFWLVPSLQKWIAEHTDFDDAGMLPGSQVQNVIVNVETGSGKGGNRPSPTLADSAEAATESHTAVAMSAPADSAPRAGLSAKQKKALMIAAPAVVVLVVVGTILGNMEPDIAPPTEADLNVDKRGTNGVTVELKLKDGFKTVKSEGHLTLTFRPWLGTGVGDVIAVVEHDIALTDFVKGEFKKDFDLDVQKSMPRSTAWLQIDGTFTPKDGKEIRFEDKVIHDAIRWEWKPMYEGPDYETLKDNILNAVDNIDRAVWRNSLTQAEQLKAFTPEQIEELKMLLKGGTARQVQQPEPMPSQPSQVESPRPVENVPPTVSQPLQKQEPSPSKVETPTPIEPEVPPAKVETPQPPPTVQPMPQQPAKETPAASSNIHSVTLKDGTKLTLNFSCVASTTTITKVTLTGEGGNGASRLIYLIVDFTNKGAAMPKIKHDSVLSATVTLGNTGYVQFTVDVAKTVNNSVVFELAK